MRIQDARYSLIRRLVRTQADSQRRAEARMQDTGCKILFLLLVFCYSLFTIHCSLSYAVSLSDIKLEALDKPVKEKWGRDPFIRYGDKMAKLKGKAVREDALAGLKINGIISDGKKAVAIINGGFYRKNEKVDDFLIVDIAKDRVSLERNRKRFYLGVEKFAMDTRRDKVMEEDKVKDKKDKKGKDKKEDKEAKE